MSVSTDPGRDHGRPTPVVDDTQDHMASGTRRRSTGTTRVDQEATSSSPPRALWGWSPPDLPAGGNVARAVDRVVPRQGIGFIVYWAVVFVLEYSVAPHLLVRERLAVEALAAVAAGIWCGVNFWRCRHAHCMVSSPGWLALGVLGIVGALIGHSVVGGFDQIVFVGVLVVAVGFEAAWHWARGTNAVWRPPRPSH